MNESKLKGLIEQMQDQFNELRANLAKSDDVDDANIVTEKVTEIPDHHVEEVTQIPDHHGEEVTEIPDHHVEEVTEMPDHHVADMFQDSRSV